MKMHTQLAIVIGSLAAVSSFSGGAFAQSGSDNLKAVPAQSEMAMPKAEKSLPVEAPIEASPQASPQASPADETMPSMKMPPVSAPTIIPEATSKEAEAKDAQAKDAQAKDTVPMPSAPTTAPGQRIDSQRPPADLPELKSVPMPVEPKVSTTSTPTGNPSAAATTMVLPRESITGITSVDLPAPPIQAAYFTLPIDLRVAKDANIASSTPISDRYTAKGSWDIKAWANAVSGCLQQKPKLVRVVGSDQVPFMLNGSEGTIMLNSSDKAVCSM